MRLIRSWPAVIPDGRAHVVDDVERLVIDNHDYTSLATVDDDVLLLEWDMAVSKEDLLRFARMARTRYTGRVVVAPYRVYYEEMMQTPVWAHRTWNGEPVGMANPVGARPVVEYAPVCNLFGLGMVYLPAGLVRRFVHDRYAARCGDVEFSMWHYRNVAPEVPILWTIRPVHLHYRMPEFRED